ncbi:MAG TPA: cation:proton antiporter [Hyphomicrobiales bacterium]|nr:cation:proton antiporter [Hyphomicrobiales bacterium]
MGEHINDLTGIAVVTAVAVVLGLLFVRLRQPPIVGYILAGLVLGPTGMGLVRQTEEIRLLAELGVIMLLFLVGMEISLRAFVLVLRPAVLTAAAQIAISLAITLGFAALLGWSTKQAVLLAFIVAVSSTAVAMSMLDDVGELRSETGRITIGVLVAQDIAIVPMLILVAAFSDQTVGLADVGWKMALAVGILLLLIALLARRGKIALPFSRAIQGKVDLVAMASVALCFGAAAVSGLLGLTAAFGAFIAGLIVANSTLRTEAIQVTQPIQSVLMVVFFLSIGLLIDLDYLVSDIVTVILFLLGVLIAKSVVNVAILHLVGEPWERAFPAGLFMAQIGEFSFVLATVGFTNGLIDGGGYKLAMAVIAMSLLISPFWMASVRRFGSVARSGITDFRAALAEVYASEIHELERGARLFRRAGRVVSRRARATHLAWRRSKARRFAAKQAQEPAEAAEDGAPTAQAAEKGEAGEGCAPARPNEIKAKRAGRAGKSKSAERTSPAAPTQGNGP